MNTTQATRFAALLVLFALISTACDNPEAPQLDDDARRDHIEADFASVERNHHRQLQQTTEHLDEARDRVEDSIEDAEKFSAEALELDDDPQP